MLPIASTVETLLTVIDKYTHLEVHMIKWGRGAALILAGPYDQVGPRSRSISD